MPGMAPDRTPPIEFNQSRSADVRALSSNDGKYQMHHSGTFCMSSHLAPLVLLLGCQRCGTASLYEDLMEHVRGARRGHSLTHEADYYAREQHFFATDAWSKGMSHYLEHLCV